MGILPLALGMADRRGSMPIGGRSVGAVRGLGLSRRLAAALLGLTLAAVPSLADEEIAVEDKEPGPVLNIDGMTFVSSRGELNEVVLWAERARFHTGADKAHLEEVRATVASHDERESFDMTCLRGELDLQTNDFYAEGDVEGHTHDGREFRAPWVRYEHEAGLLFTDAPVEIIEVTGTYRGGGFRYFVREQRFRLLGGASVVQDGEP